MTNKNIPSQLILLLVLTLAQTSLACSAPPRAASNLQKDTPADSNPNANSTGNEPSQHDAQSVEDRTLIAVSKAIRRAHLTDRPDECLAYRFDPNVDGDAYLVEVRENHRRASCGGDPQTQPRLFTVSVNKKTQAMSTDRGSPGQFQPLQQVAPPTGETKRR